MTTIEHLLIDRANTMAAHDGVPPGVVHFHGAANQLQAELLSARDRLIHAPAAPIGTGPEEHTAEAEPVVAETALDQAEPPAEVEAIAEAAAAEEQAS